MYPLIRHFEVEPPSVGMNLAKLSENPHCKLDNRALFLQKIRQKDPHRVLSLMFPAIFDIDESFSRMQPLSKSILSHKPQSPNPTLFSVTLKIIPDDPSYGTVHTSVLSHCPRTTYFCALNNSQPTNSYYYANLKPHRVKEVSRFVETPPPLNFSTPTRSHHFFL